LALGLASPLDDQNVSVHARFEKLPALEGLFIRVDNLLAVSPGIDLSEYARHPLGKCA
jgi:hypothetical protein